MNSFLFVSLFVIIANAHILNIDDSNLPVIIHNKYQKSFDYQKDQLVSVGTSELSNWVSQYGISNQWTTNIINEINLMVGSSRFKSYEWVYKFETNVGKLNIIFVNAVSDDNNHIKFNVDTSEFVQNIPNVYIHTRTKYARGVHTPFGNIGGNGYEDFYNPRSLNGGEVDLVKKRIINKAREVHGVQAYLN